MKKYLILSFSIILFSCKQKLIVVETTNHVNEIESFIHHINISSKQSGSISIGELNFIKNKLVLDSNKSDYKGQNLNLLSFGFKKLEEEYQSKIND